MKTGSTPLCVAFSLCVGILVIGCGGGKGPNESVDLESLKVELKQQVVNGELTAEQAQVRFAEATREAKIPRGGKSKKDDPKSEALRALGAELQAKVETGELTAEEAKTKWSETIQEMKESTPGGGEQETKVGAGDGSKH